MTLRAKLSVGLSVLVLGLGTLARADNSGNLVGKAHLAGRNEVPPVGTRGQGQATFKWNVDDSVGFRLNVANVVGVTQAHIHCGEAGVNGPVVVFLFGLVSSGVNVNGVLARGSFTEADIIPRPDSEACPGGVASLADLIDKMQSGEAYVNVHTLENPGGEVRGQISTPGY